MLDRSQQHADADRQQTTRARQEAEALFKPRSQVDTPVAAAPVATEPSVRKPRILTISPPVSPRLEEPAAPVSPEETVSRITQSQVVRIRAWVKYGMTVSQVAEVCGVPAGEIERILRTA